MKLKTKQFKQVCSKILSALDNNSINGITDNVELKTIDKFLYLSVTNKEYYVSVKFEIEENEDFHATINATTFLKLISQITTDEIELNLDFNNINIKGNGQYKIPLIFEDNKVMELPKINILNTTLNMNISKSILDSINLYNSREIIKENISRPVQKMYYIDENGCITFTGVGACVNSFTLEKPIKILLNNKIVKLFKLFNSENINFKLGYDAISDSILQTKISLYDDEVEIDAILSCDDTQLNSVPVEAIRRKINKSYPYSVVIDKNLFNQALNRLLIFSKNSLDINTYYKFNFNPYNLTISDTNEINMESIKYQNSNIPNLNYTLNLNINEFKLILDGCDDQYLTLLFGNKEAVVVVRNEVKNILMEYFEEDDE